ncbi:MAG: sensor histidine kinase [Candidatus Scalindua sp.]
MKSFWSIKNKLLVFALSISLVPIFVITPVYYLSARKALKQQISEKMIAVAESKKLHVETFLNAIEARATDFSSDGFIRDSLNIINRKGLLKQDAVINLNKHIKDNKLPLDPDMASITILDKAGMVVASTVESIIGKDFSDYEEYVHVMDKDINKVFTHRPHFSEYLGQNAMDVAAPIISMESGESIGIIMNAYKHAIIDNITSNRKGMGDSGEIVLGLRDGDNIQYLNSLRYAPGAALTLKIPLEEEASEPMRLALEGHSGTIIGPDYRGTIVIAAYQHIPAMHWGLVAKMDRAEAFESLRLLGIIALVLGGTGSLAVVAICIMFAVRASRSINELTDATEKFANGDLNYRIKISRNDEIGALGRSFNDMAEKLSGEITEHKQSKDKLAATNKELEAFCYSVSHDLRAPLRSIEGFSKALEEDYAENLNSQGKDYFQRIQRSSRHMSQLIDDLLNLSRITRSDMNYELVDMSAMAEGITTVLRSKQPERQVELVISKKIKAKGDKRLLCVALENLLDNAWKFTGKHPHSRIEFGVTHNNGKEVYFVRDDGAGFDMAYVDKLFTAFQRLHDIQEFEGTGVGLATVQRIIHRHGGRIWAEGEVERGATFYFTL